MPVWDSLPGDAGDEVVLDSGIESGVEASTCDASSDAGSGSFTCYIPAPTAYCYTYSGLNPCEVSAEKSACLSMSGASSPPSCPTASLTGCCMNIHTAGLTYGYCYYSLPSSDIPSLMSACASVGGSWTP